MGRFLETFVETFIFRSRWLLAPLYLGLVATLFLLLAKFFMNFAEFSQQLLYLKHTQLIASILSLVDIVLISNLLIMVIFSGYQSFVSKLDMIAGGTTSEHPEWMGRVSYSDIKLRVIGSIVAISTIELLKVFINIENVDKEQIAWMVGIHLTFAISGVLFALMEKLMHAAERNGNNGHAPQAESATHH